MAGWDGIDFQSEHLRYYHTILDNTFPISHCCGQVILWGCKMNHVKLQVLQCIFLGVKYFILFKFCMLQNSIKNNKFWYHFAQVKISHFTRILQHPKSHANIKFYSINLHKEKLLILPDWKPKVKFHVLIKDFAVWKILSKTWEFAVFKICLQISHFPDVKISSFMVRFCSQEIFSFCQRIFQPGKSPQNDIFCKMQN